MTALFIVAFIFIAGAIAQRSVLRESDYLANVLAPVLVDRANTHRASLHVAPLVVNPKLSIAATLKAQDMAARGYFAHVSPEGTLPWYWFGQADYQFKSAGENLAVHFDDSEAVSDAWMASPSHRANIVNGLFTEVGIGTARGVYEGRETLFVVQMFGTPRVAAPVAVAPKATIETQAPVKKPATPVAPVITPPAIQPAPEPLAVAETNAGSPATVELPPLTLGAQTAVADEKIARPQLSLTRFVTSPSRALEVSLRLLILLLAIPLIFMALHHIPLHRHRHVVAGLVFMLVVSGAVVVFRMAAVSSVAITTAAALVESAPSLYGN